MSSTTVVAAPMPSPPSSETSAVTGAPTVRRRRPRLGLTLAWFWIALVTFVALTADFLPLKEYGQQLVLGSFEKPSVGLSEPFGGDLFGRSILSRIVYGGRVTLSVGLFSVMLALVIGGVLGLFAGYVGGKLDYLFTTLTDAMLAFPPIVLLLTLRAVLVNPDQGRLFTIPKLVAILGTLAIPNFYRQTRAQVLARRDKGYVLSAEALGARRTWILFRELAPNVMLPVVSIGFVVMASLMVAEGSLSLLGFGLPEPQPSWGKMIFDGKQNLEQGTNMHVALIPMFVLILTVFSFNIVGEAMRKKFDSRVSRI